MRRETPFSFLVLGSFVACTAIPDAPDLPEATLQQRADRVAREVARIRDLTLEAPVKAGSKDKAALRDAMSVEIEKEWERQNMALTERAWKGFGLLPADYDLRTQAVEFLEDQVGGYYDPEKKEFFTIDASDDDAAEGDADDDAEKKPRRTKSGGDEVIEQTFVLAHELTHAIDDQHFDLEKLRSQLPSDDDRATAFTSLIEGGAMETGVDHLFDRVGAPLSTTGPILRQVIRLVSFADATELGGADAQGVEDSLESLRDAPPIMGRPLVFPYFNGWHFVNRVRSEFGWAGVDAMYADPPDSTEQILHPERYFDRRDRPVNLTLPAGPDGFELVHQQTMGMLGIQVLLDMFFGSGAAGDSDGDGEEYAEGWDGDRYVLWSVGGGEAMGWVVVFDHDGQAEDFERVYRGILARRFGDSGGYAVTRRDHVVAAAWNAPPDRAAEAAKHLLDHTRIEVAADDQPPDRWWWDVLLFPLALQSFDRAWQGDVLAGHAIHYRGHDRGHRFHLLDGLVLESENNPDRSAFWMALGLIGFNYDRTIDYAFWRVPLVHNGHWRGDGPTYRSRYGVAIDAFRYDNVRGAKTFELLWGVVCTVRWGDQVEEKPGLRILFIPIPGT